MRPLHAVSLIDAQTGRPHRIGGAVLILFTHFPDDAAKLLMRNRDPEHWRVETRAFSPQTQF
jgi:hypothetical protein